MPAPAALPSFALDFELRLWAHSRHSFLALEPLESPKAASRCHLAQHHVVQGLDLLQIYVNTWAVSVPAGLDSTWERHGGMSWLDTRDLNTHVRTSSTGRRHQTSPVHERLSTR